MIRDELILRVSSMNGAIRLAQKEKVNQSLSALLRYNNIFMRWLIVILTSR